MQPKQFLQWFSGNVSKRSGISRVTIETVLPHIFDEIRYQLTEGTHCMPIEAFGTFFTKDYPERQRHYTYNGQDKIVTTPAHSYLKFSPITSFKREVMQGKFDATRQSFHRKEGERAIRSRIQMKYRKPRTEVSIRSMESNSDINKRKDCSRNA